MLYQIETNNNFRIDKSGKSDISIKTDSSTQTDSKFQDEPDEPVDIKKEPKNFIRKEKRKRKNSPDLIRSRIFNFLNKNIYKWISKTKRPSDNIKLYQYSLGQNNKMSISDTMDKYLKDLFVSETDKDKINQIENDLLRSKLEKKYMDIYNLFIKDKEENNSFTENFIFFEDYLKELEKKEDNEYIEKVRKVTFNYERWKDKKVHIDKIENVISKKE